MICRLEVHHVTPRRAPAFPGSPFNGWPVQGPLKEDLLRFFVNKEVFRVETESPVVLEPGFQPF